MKKNNLKVFESWENLRKSRKHRHGGRRGERAGKKFSNIHTSKHSAKAGRGQSISEEEEKPGSLTVPLQCLAYWLWLLGFHCRIH